MHSGLYFQAKVFWFLVPCFGKGQRFLPLHWQLRELVKNESCLTVCCLVERSI